MLTASGWTTRWGEKRTKRPVVGLPSRAYSGNLLIVGKYRRGLYPRIARMATACEAGRPVFGLRKCQGSGFRVQGSGFRAQIRTRAPRGAPRESPDSLRSLAQAHEFQAR